MKPSFHRTGSLLFTSTALACLLLAGCASSTSPAPIVVVPPPSGTYAGVAFTGKVMVGAQPVVAASVQLYAAGTTGNGSAPTSLLTAALTTDSNGAFSIPAAYTCPTSASQLYLVARGGTVGVGSANSVIALLTTVGACNQIVAASQVTLNEVTTAANVWALSQFLAPGAKVGATSTNTAGIANAVATAASFSSPTTGLALPASGAAPAPRINMFANLLHTCAASSASSAACTNLLGSSADTLDAALRIVRNPAANVAALYTQSTSTTTFAPTLTTAPSDWTLFLKFTGAAMNYPTGVAVDSTGSIWVANYFSVASKFTPLGVPVFANGITGFGINNSYGIAIDSKDNVWIPNQQSPGVNGGLGSITVLNSAGSPVSGATGYIAGGLDYPTAIAMDTDDSAWIVDYGNSHVTHLSNSGQPLSGATGYTAPSLAFADSIVLDANHNAWVGDQNDTFVNQVSSTGAVTPFNCCDGPNGLAVDQSGNIWIANYYGNSISEISSTGAIVSNGAYTANGTINHPQGIAIDGAGNLWIANFRATYLTQLAGTTSTTPGQPLSPPAGWAPDSNLFGAYAIAVDSSGNLWVTNLTDNSLSEFIGLAVPVKTPLIGPPRLP